MTPPVLYAIVLPTIRYSETITFYRDILGFECKEVKSNVFATCKLNERHVMHIRVVDEGNNWRPPGSGIYLEFMCRSADEICERLTQYGWEYKVNNARLLELEIYDPNGNLIKIKSLSALGTKPQTNEEWQHDVFKMRYSFTASMCLEMRISLYNLCDALRDNGVVDRYVVLVQESRAKVEELLDKCKLLINTHKPFEESSYHDEKRTSDEVENQIHQVVEHLQVVIEQINEIPDLEQAKDVHRNIGQLKGMMESLIQITYLGMKDAQQPHGG